jgi:protein SCO1
MSRRGPVPILVSGLLISAPCEWTARAMEPPRHQPGVTAAARYGRADRAYQVPNVNLIDQDGRSIALQSLLDTTSPVFLNFIFASCSTVCPVLSAGLAGFQHSLGDRTARPLLVSITIDPEHDTPEVLHAYARRFDARQGWLFLTGARADVDSVMQAFDVYVSNRMNHRPVTLMRRGNSDHWTRIEGFMSVADYAREYAALADH